MKRFGGWGSIYTVHTAEPCLGGKTPKRARSIHDRNPPRQRKRDMTYRILLVLLAVLKRRTGRAGRVAPLGLWLLVLVVACEPDARSGPQVPAQTVWTSEAEFKIGAAHGGPAAFSWVHSVRAYGGRVLVLEPNESRVTIWTPEGSLLLDRERRGAGPGEFIRPYRIHLGASSFRVRDQQRFTELSSDGEVLSTATNPPTSVSFRGFRIQAEAHLSDGSYMGVAQLPARVQVGSEGDDPVDRIPVFHIRETDQGWTLDEIYRLDQANSIFRVEYREGAVMWSAQLLSDQDLHEVDLGTGTLVVVRRKGGAGLVEVLEVATSGDTLWRRQYTVAPIPITSEVLERYADLHTEMVESFVARMQGGLSGAGDLRKKAVEAMYVPESGYLPPVRRLVLSSSGHVWLRIRTQPEADTLREWYSFPRGGDVESPARKVLLPSGFRIMDATDTHVWGTWRDSLDIPYVVGRRLVRQK